MSARALQPLGRRGSLEGSVSDEGAPLMDMLDQSPRSSTGTWAYNQRQSSWLRRTVDRLRRRLRRGREVAATSRTVCVGFQGEGLRPGLQQAYAPNVVCNQKYHPSTFVFVVLFNQFKFFFNAYFLLVALTQFIPPLKIGYLITYIGPLAFVLAVTMAKEAYDDFNRYVRDREANSQRYRRLTPDGLVELPASAICVGDLIQLGVNERVPADMVLLRTSEKGGASFIRTDQLDGETDWKLRHAVPFSQQLPNDRALTSVNASIYAGPPSKEIYNFVGNFSRNEDSANQVESLSLENTLWANTVVASGTVVGVVVYTGRETRAIMNTMAPVSKVGLLDSELNRLSKVLFVVLVSLSLLLTALKGFTGLWYLYFMRFILLFSGIIPISMRVNLDLAKTAYSLIMMSDNKIPGTVARNSTIPEELGRISYLLSDKTGTLTQNEMEFRRLHIGSVLFSQGSLDEVRQTLLAAYEAEAGSSGRQARGKMGVLRATIPARLREAATALALCHNVTPVIDDSGARQYNSCSPDEIALVQYAEDVGLVLDERTRSEIVLRNPLGDLETYIILNEFPFSSERKRMGIILKNKDTGEIFFFMKGADAVMGAIVQENDWLEEECDNMARAGLRTLVFGRKTLSEEAYNRFSHRFASAKTALQNRATAVQNVIESLEVDLELIGLTGVEDKLQEHVKTTLETLRNAGIKIWMLTGDKMETATCIAISSRLVSRTQTIFQMSVSTEAEAREQLAAFSRKGAACCLVIDGKSLEICLEHFRTMFVELACKAPSVACCRCSPTQKAQIVALLKDHTGKRTCAIGDGGNDVSMILEADVGVGIVGKEGKQASLAADFSILQFSYLSRLILWHGRNSYRRSAVVAQFVAHRGMVISVIQAVYSAIFYFSPTAIFDGYLWIGYATYYTALPVLSLILDHDVDERLVFLYPELYQMLLKGRLLSFRTFATWVAQSIYQGCAIMVLTVALFESSFINIVSISFTVLILAQLLNVALEIHNWTRWMVYAQIVSLIVYFGSMAMLPIYFDLDFVLSGSFAWKVTVITAAGCLPVYLGKFLHRRFAPPVSSKVGE